MSRWIDADEAEKWLRAGCAYVIRELPSIDIVRCGECEKSFNAEGEWICNHLSGMVGLNVVVKADDFCSYGERTISKMEQVGTTEDCSTVEERSE